MQQRLRIATSGKPRTIWFGGAELYKYEIKGAELKVFCEDKKTICDISLPFIGIIGPIMNNPKSVEVAKSLPSVIGVDLLIHHRFSLYFSPCQLVAYLEKYNAND